ncbi:hypothetical protein A2U01_0099480, partial [Trifolium medium]|nr:hypothetical protein [Trifolium medium]
DTDEISSPERPLGHTYFRRAVGDLQVAEAATTPQPPPPAQQQEQHQVPPHIPQQLGMAATLYEQHYRMNWGLPCFS